MTKTIFKAFPEFSKLTFADKDKYEAFTKDYPPISDTSFFTLVTWWDGLGDVSISRLNGNLVISYWLPGDETYSGLCLVGTEKVDESMCDIFDHLRGKGETPRLVNVPEFTVHSLKYPEMFSFTPQRRDDEYILAISRLTPLENLPKYRRVRVRRFIRSMGEDNIELTSVDLSKPENRALLLDVAGSWPRRGINNMGKIEQGVLRKSVHRASALGVRNLCLFVGGELCAFTIYHIAQDKRYAFIDHARANYDIPRVFDYISHAFPDYLAKQGVKYLNIHADYGSGAMRVIKLALRPVNFFRKYTIEPS